MVAGGHIVLEVNQSMTLPHVLRGFNPGIEYRRTLLNRERLKRRISIIEGRLVAGLLDLLPLTEPESGTLVLGSLFVGEAEPLSRGMVEGKSLGMFLEDHEVFGVGV